jgi:hypothetical protein
MIHIDREQSEIKEKTPLDHALALSEQGLAVFPVGENKVPRCPHGHLDATADSAAIKALHRQFGFVLVGVATGEPSGWSALDIDVPAGEAWWTENRAKLPQTRTHRTRRGGLHLWFRHAPGLRSSVARIAPGIDVRATGASAVWWPAAGLETLSNAPPADWPSWLLPPPRPTWTPAPAQAWQGGDASARRYGLAALKRAIEAVAGAAHGTRNAALNRETFSLLRLTDQGAINASEIAEAMAHAALASGLDRREIENTLRSALAARGGR